MNYNNRGYAVMTDAEQWIRTHEDVPTMTECEDLGCAEGYDSEGSLVIQFKDSSRLIDGVPHPADYS